MKIRIRYLAGSRANQADEFPPEGELIAGRDPSSQIRFDPDRDDLVSRQHLKIMPAPGTPNAFQLVDLQSRNGTFLNRQRVYGSIRLSHNDAVQLGAGGPEFRFELEPPPLPTPSQVMAQGNREVKATREVWMSDATAVPRPVGRGTVERMLGDVFTRVRRDRRRSLIAGAVAIVLLGAMTAFLWVYLSRSRAELQNTLAAAQEKSEANQKEVAEELKKGPVAIEAAQKQVQQLEAQLRDANDRNSSNQKQLMQALDAARQQTAALSRAFAAQQKAQASLPVADNMPARPVVPGYDATLAEANEKLERGEAAGAFEFATKLIQQDPNRYEAYGIAAQSADKLGDFLVAADMYQRAIGKAPGDAKARLEEQARLLQEKMK